MDSVLLKNFLALAQTKNFTKAAQKLFLSQSALSLQIVRLEALIGKPLFIRSKRSVMLTLEGEQLIGYAQQMLRLEEQMLTQFHQPPLIGEVKFGTPEDLATAYLPNILANFVETYPGILLNVDCKFTQDLLKGFEAKSYDLVLIKQNPQEPHPCSQVVWKESLVWVCAKEKIHCKRIANTLPLVLSPSPCVYRKRAIDILNQQGVPWRIVYTSTSLTGALAAVKAGLGISVLPINMKPKDLEIVSDLPPLQDAQIALLQQEGTTEATKALVQYIVSHIDTDRKTYR